MTDFFAIAERITRQHFQPEMAAIQADAEEMDAAITPPLPDGPRECCADWAAVTDCRHGIDTWLCPWCGRTWSAPCR
jgi:hypothetical protein